MSQKHQIIIPGSLATIAILSGAIFASTLVFADDAIDEVSITVPASCTISGTGTNSHNATIINGQYNSNIGETTIKVTCNDKEGFAIYAIGYTDNTDGKNVLTSSTLSSTYDISTGTATSGDTSNWAMKLSTISSPSPTYPITIQNSFDSFHNVPDDYTLVAKRISGTDIGTNAGGATLKTTYQAYISSTQFAGTYTGQVKYTLVHPNDAAAPTKPIDYTEEIDCPAGYICYSPASNNALGTMNVQDVGIYVGDSESVIGYQAATSNTTKTLIAPNFKNSGYGFVGWNTEIDGTGTTYGPNEDIATPDLFEEGLALYAKWIPSAGNMQGWTGCSTMSTNQVTALTDTRDNDVYAVAKLADGNCWMIENLRLDNTAAINSQNTNNPNQNFALSATSDNWCIYARDYECSHYSELNTNNTNIGEKNSSGIDLISSYISAYTSSQWYSYGNYYNWFSAVSGNEFGLIDPTDSPGDICPTGWALPTGTSSGQFYALNIAINSGSTETSVGFRAYPNNFIYAGDLDPTYPEDGYRGSIGFYQSLTNGGEDSNGIVNASYRFVMSANYVSLATFPSDNTYGSSVRCLLKTN